MPERCVEKANLTQESSTPQFINFMKEGTGSGNAGITSKRRSILSTADVWEITADLSEGGYFPVEIAITNSRPDDCDMVTLTSARENSQFFGRTTLMRLTRETCEVC